MTFIPIPLHGEPHSPSLLGVTITSDGTAANTEVRDAKTGAFLSGVQKIIWELDCTKPDQPVRVWLEVLAYGETRLQGAVVSNLARAICPECGRLHEMEA